MAEALSAALSKLIIKSEENERPLKVKEEPKDENFENIQSYFTWVKFSEFEASGATAQQFIDIIEDRFLDTTTETEIALKFKATELISDKGTLAFTNVYINNLFEARAALAEAREFIQICSKHGYEDELHLTGFDYVFDCLEIYMDGKEHHDAVEIDIKLLKGLPDYQELNEKSKAAVLAMKFYFHRQLRKDMIEQIRTSDEMISLEPDCPEWHFCKSQCLKYQRRASHVISSQPLVASLYEAEIMEIDKANELSVNHPQYMLAYCSILAESARRIKPTYQEWRTPLPCGKKEFKSVAEVAEYLKEECRKILNAFDQSVRVNVTIADIFMKWLPRSFRDFNFAESCIKRALQLHPKSSKANHRMAMYCMMRTPGLPEDIKKAEEYCATAVECDPRNFPACAELIQILLGKPQENEQRILDILNTYLKKGSKIPLTPRSSSDLHFYKGLLLHLLPGRELEAVDNWMIAQDLQSPLRFDFLLYNHQRYKYPPDHLVVGNLRKTIMVAMADAQFSSSKPVNAFDNLLSNIKEVEQRSQNEKAMIESRTRGSNGFSRGTRPRGIRPGGAYPRGDQPRGSHSSGSYPRGNHARGDHSRGNSANHRGDQARGRSRPPNWRPYGDHGIEDGSWRR